MGDKLSKIPVEVKSSKANLLREDYSFDDLKNDVKIANDKLAKLLATKIQFKLRPENEPEVPLPHLWKLFVQIEIIVPNSPSRKLNVKQFCRLNNRLQDLINELPPDASEHPKMLEGLLDFERECSICMDRTADIVLNCTHAFCSLCIDGWRAKHDTCPMCRCTIKETEDDWVLTGSGPKADDVSEYLTKCVQYKQ